VSETLGDRMKAYESMFEGRLMDGLPVLARVDGRAFHTVTRGMRKPYDGDLQGLMGQTTGFLVDEFAASAGYFQSDEISLLWRPSDPQRNGEMLFGGRVQKIASVVASAAAAYFNALFDHLWPDKASLFPHFDARVWQVPTEAEAANYFLWRERDAVRNSILGAAHSMFGPKAVMNKNTSELQDMMVAAGQNWNDFPAVFKRGKFYRRVVEERRLTDEEASRLPEKHEARQYPGLIVKRSRVVAVDCPPLGQVTNKEDFLFRGCAPMVAGDGQLVA
jgi:tRNA(His) guanylyltransferase